MSHKDEKSLFPEHQKCLMKIRNTQRQNNYLFLSNNIMLLSEAYTEKSVKKKNFFVYISVLPV